MQSIRSRRGSFPIAFADQTPSGDSDEMAATPSPPMLRGLTAAVTRVVCVSPHLCYANQQLHVTACEPTAALQCRVLIIADPPIRWQSTRTL